MAKTKAELEKMIATLQDEKHQLVEENAALAESEPGDGTNELEKLRAALELAQQATERAKKSTASMKERLAAAAEKPPEPVPEDSFARAVGRRKDGSVVLDVQLPTADEADATLKFWIGTLPGSPWQNITLGGVNFPGHTGNPGVDVMGKPKGKIDFGIEQDLSDAMFERVVTAIENTVVRKVGPRAQKIDVRSKGFRPAVEDRPIGCYVYMVEIRETMPAKWRSQVPSPVVSRDVPETAA